MLAGLDSSDDPPSSSQALAAKAAGVSMWSGYLATKGGVNLLHTWTQGNFNNARLCGATPIAFCSGLDNPTACKSLAAAWNVRLCLDVETSIRADGSWVQAWLDASGAGLYGEIGVHSGRSAPFHILAAYPGSNPNATWYSGYARPSGPCGWQWEGGHTEFGAEVDRGWYDDWFGPVITQPVTPPPVTIPPTTTTPSSSAAFIGLVLLAGVGVYGYHFARAKGVKVGIAGRSGTAGGFGASELRVTKVIPARAPIKEKTQSVGFGQSHGFGQPHSTTPKLSRPKVNKPTAKVSAFGS